MTESSNHAIRGASEDPEFAALVQAIIDRPEKIYSEDVTSEQALKLQKHLNPYSYIPGADSGPTVRVAAASFTNIREDYLRRFTMTSLVGFVFRMMEEWDPSRDIRRWVPTKKAKELQTRVTAPFTVNDLELRAQVLTEFAALARQSEEEATGQASLLEKHNREELTFSEEEMKNEEKVRPVLEQALKLSQAATAARAKAAAMLYISTTEMRKLGFEADDRLPATEDMAHKFPEIAPIIDEYQKEGSTKSRPLPGGHLEIPKENALRIVKEFLSSLFEYDPDQHVRSAHDKAIVDLTTREKTIAGLSKAVPLDVSDPERLPVSAVLERAQLPSASHDRDPFEILTASQRNYNAACCLLRSEDTPLSDAVRYMLKDPETIERFRHLLLPLAAESEVRSALQHVPPQDTFHRWGYYTEVNFEELRTVTNTLYHEKPDLDWALLLYDTFEGTPAEIDTKLEQFRDQHIDEVMSDIKAVQFGAWTLLGDFKKNRERINIYNKNTDILKRILDRHAMDKKMGGDLMRNRVRKTKARNIKEQGPDAPGLNEYRASGTALQAGERVISPEDMKRLERARGNLKAAKELEVFEQCEKAIHEMSELAKRRPLTTEEKSCLKKSQDELIRAREMLEVPEDAIQVDYFVHDTTAGTLSKDHFYTKAEAPTYLQEHRERVERLMSGLPPSQEESFYPPSARAPGASKELAGFAKDFLSGLQAKES